MATVYSLTYQRTDWLRQEFAMLELRVGSFGVYSQCSSCQIDAAQAESPDIGKIVSSSLLLADFLRC